ncbi:hypothetical protein [Halobaculum sp. EA56]|uniref:hypothetical protein n=1 Tax=Halobaculum sp. EA56 TaxID=3421648 RepID=UPI003EC05247
MNVVSRCSSVLDRVVAAVEWSCSTWARRRYTATAGWALGATVALISLMTEVTLPVVGVWIPASLSAYYAASYADSAREALLLGLHIGIGVVLLIVVTAGPLQSYPAGPEAWLRTPTGAVLGSIILSGAMSAAVALAVGGAWGGYSIVKSVHQLRSGPTPEERVLGEQYLAEEWTDE